MFAIFFWQVAAGSRGRAGDGHSLQVADWRGQLQLEVRLSLRVPRRRGEDCHLQERVHVLLGRNNQQGNAVLLFE